MVENWKNKTLVILAGPTASGKTHHAIKLALDFKSEIISADSRQFYRELKIGVASPRVDELRMVPHHFVGHKSIFEYYNASLYEVDVMEKLNKLFEKSDVVILTGGSGLYIDTVCNGIDDLPEIDLDLRNQLIARLVKDGLEPLKELLSKVDPIFYKAVDINNPKRILKALEITLQTGKPYSSFLTRTKKVRPFAIVKTGLMPLRERLYELINQRVDLMISSGLQEEARELYPHKRINALNTVGYQEMFDYFDGLISLEEAIRLIKRNTRHYAKRQITWFKRDPGYTWFLPEQEKELKDYIRQQIC